VIQKGHPFSFYSGIDRNRMIVLLTFLLLAEVQHARVQPQFAEIARQAGQAREANRLDDAIRLYREAVHLKPSWTEGWWYLSTIFYDQDRYAEGRGAFRRYVALDPKVGPAWALLGLCEFQTREYEQALVHLREGEALGYGGNERIRRVARYHLGILLSRFEQYDFAIQKLIEEAKAESEENASIVEALGIAGLRRPLLPAEAPPQDHELIIATGRALYLAGVRSAAESAKAFQDLVARYSTTPNVHYLYGSYLLISDPDKGLAELKQELEISPRHVPALVQVASEYLKRGEAANGLAYARKAVEIDANSFVTHNVLGRLLLESGDTLKAVEELEVARKLAPDSPQTRLALANAYSRAGRKEESAREREAFLKLKKQSEAAANEQGPADK
jgi:cytochrome c-type biogenesis protein CcmH/NrfG